MKERCSEHGKDDAYEILDSKPEWKDYFGDLCVDWRIIVLLKLILQK
jgi:hypothetical protein